MAEMWSLKMEIFGPSTWKSCLTPEEQETAATSDKKMTICFFMLIISFRLIKKECLIHKHSFILGED